MDIPTLHKRTVGTFSRYVHTVSETQWFLPTPCAGWDVRTLVNHIVYENLWTVPLFEGATIADVGDRFEGDVLGAEPLRAWDRSCTAAVQAIGAPGAMQRLVHLSFGNTPGSEYAMQLAADHLIHGWDLAKAIDADDSLDPELVEVVATWYADREETYRAGGVVAQRPEEADDADPQTRLLAAFGRKR